MFSVKPSTYNHNALLSQRRYLKLFPPTCATILFCVVLIHITDLDYCYISRCGGIL